MKLDPELFPNDQAASVLHDRFQRLSQKGVIVLINLADGKIVSRAPVGVDLS
jgi:hypothetical protein